MLNDCYPPSIAAAVSPHTDFEHAFRRSDYDLDLGCGLDSMFCFGGVGIMQLQRCKALAVNVVQIRNCSSEAFNVVVAELLGMLGPAPQPFHCCCPRLALSGRSGMQK